MTLSILIWLPAVAGLLDALVGRRRAGLITAAGAAFALAVSIDFLIRYESNKVGSQFVTDETWISALGISYKLGIDGLNVVFLLLTTVVFLAAIVWANFKQWEQRGQLFLMLGVAEAGVLGAFAAQDLVLFVAFFDLMLIPFYFLVGIWGQGDRRRAALKLFVYTLVGSLLMLAAALATGVLAAAQNDGDISFAYSDLLAQPLSGGTQDWIFLCFAAAFLVKMPAFPIHGWLPDAYRSMPLPALAVFSGVLSKVAAYGFIKVCLPLFPLAVERFQVLLMLIALASILYGSAMAFTTTNARLIVGYSSVAQLGFITLGIFALERTGAQGALLQSVNHALVTAPLLLIVGLLAARAGGSEDIRDMGGIAFRAPVLAGLFLVVALATLAMPGSTNFVGEILILLGAFQAKVTIAIVASIGVALASVYMLRAFIRTMHNRVGPRVESREIGWRDAVVLVPLVVVIIGLSLYPQGALKQSEPTVDALIPANGGAQAAPATAEVVP